MSQIRTLLERFRASPAEQCSAEYFADLLEAALIGDGLSPTPEGSVSVMGMHVKPIPDNWQPLNVIMVIECLKMGVEEIIPGRYPYGLVCRATEGLALWTAEGMVDWVSRQIINQSTDTDDD